MGPPEAKLLSRGPRLEEQDFVSKLFAELLSQMCVQLYKH